MKIILCPNYTTSGHEAQGTEITVWKRYLHWPCSQYHVFAITKNRNSKVPFNT